MSLVLTELSGRVLTIRLNRPERLNAVVPELFADLSAALDVAAGPEVGAVVLTGAGRGFCVGGDIKGPPPSGPPAQRMRTAYQPVMAQLAALDVPVVAAVNGPAAGAGLSLAAAADIRIASPAARLIGGFASVGLSPDTGATYFLTRLVGYSRAFEILLTRREVPLDTALDWGLLTEIVTAEDLLPRAHEIAAGLAAVAGVAVAETKRLLQQAALRQLADQLECETLAYARSASDEGRTAAREAVRKRIS